MTKPLILAQTDTTIEAQYSHLRDGFGRSSLISCGFLRGTAPEIQHFLLQTLMMKLNELAPLARRARNLALVLLCICYVCLSGDAKAQVLKWEIEGTIVEIEDPEMLFPDVRLGDPLRGFLSYDLNAVPDDENPNNVFYEHDLSFEVAGMVIDNPRDGSEIGFLPDTELGGFVNIINDGEDPDLGLTDSVAALQAVLPPNGVPGFFPPFATVAFIGPPEVLGDASLPLELHLEDWPDAVIGYIDIFSGAFVFAEIHTLALVVPEPSSLALLVIASVGVLHRSKSRVSSRRR